MGVDDRKTLIFRHDNDPSALEQYQAKLAPAGCKEGQGEAPGLQ